MLLGYDVGFLESKKGVNTAQEIAQQPTLWKETIDIVSKMNGAIQDLHATLLTGRDVRIILTGAGSSAFGGCAIGPFLSKMTGRLIEPIATTDIVNSPEEYFIADIPTVLISFARSGNSPESVAAVNLGKQIIDNFKSIVITCNKDGELAAISRADEEDMLLLMPDKSHDKGFAMTSSLTCMMTACLLLLLKNTDEAQRWIGEAAEKSEQLIKNFADTAQEIANKDAKKIIFLGSASQTGIAREAALKCLELTAGKITATYDSPMGFRHGPKSLVDPSSMVVFFLSGDPYSRQYDLDMLQEMSDDGVAGTIVTLSGSPDATAEQLSDFFICTKTPDLPDALNGLLFLVLSQMVAVGISLKLGISPDNPSPSGMVNRVVQGVVIYPYKDSNLINS